MGQRSVKPQDPRFQDPTLGVDLATTDEVILESRNLDEKVCRPCLLAEVIERLWRPKLERPLIVDVEPSIVPATTSQTAVTKAEIIHQVGHMIEQASQDREASHIRLQVSHQDASLSFVIRCGDFNRAETFRCVWEGLVTPYASRVASVASSTASNGSKVLIADDSKAVSADLKRMALGCGLEPITAQNGAEAVELYRMHKDDIRCVMMDLNMPVMDGFQATASILEDEEAPPVMAMCASPVNRLQEQRYMDFGFQNVTVKPRNMREMRRAVLLP